MIILMIFFIAQRGEASEQYGQTTLHAAIIHQHEAGSWPWRTSPTERDNNELVRQNKSSSPPRKRVRGRGVLTAQ